MFSFANLNLSKVAASSGVGVLQPGRYVVKVSAAEVVDNKAKDGKILKVKLSCDQGVITDNINVMNKSEKATEIGLGQLKALLECGGHPNPNNPGDISTLRGLTVGIYVAQDGMYDGKPQYKVKGYMKPSDVGTGNVAPKAAAPAPAIGGNDDDIPF